MENSVSLPQNPFLGVFLTVGHRKSCTAMFTKKSEPQPWIRSSLESRVRSCPRHHLSNVYYSRGVRVRKSIAVWSLLKFPIKCSKTHSFKNKGKTKANISLTQQQQPRRACQAWVPSKMCTEPFHTLSAVCWSIKEVGRHPENWFNSADTVESEKEQEGDEDQQHTADLPPAGDTVMHHAGPAGADCAQRAQRCPAAVERDGGITSSHSCYRVGFFFGPDEIGRWIFG